MHFPKAVCLLVFVCFGCSDDSGGGGGSAGADASTSGGSGGATGGTGGAATGGTAGGGAGGLGAGGSDPALCNIDTGTDECLLCLARYCCGDIEACYADATCKEEFDKQQACWKSPDAGTDRSACYSTFVLAGSGDGGPPTHPVAQCIFNPCGMCGKPSPL
jgi:hypothetical protein